jgi:hypothetical protein
MARFGAEAKAGEMVSATYVDEGRLDGTASVEPMVVVAAPDAMAWAVVVCSAASEHVEAHANRAEW